MTNNKKYVPKKDIAPTIVSMMLRGFGLLLFLVGIIILLQGSNPSIENILPYVMVILCIGLGLNLFGIHSQIYLLIAIKDALQKNDVV